MLDEFRSSHITWDKATSRIYSTITANESDENGRKLVVQIINGGQVEDLTGVTLHLYWETIDKAHDGLDGFKAVDLKNGEFELSYTTGMLSNKGVLNANLVLVDAVGRIVSERFKITVTEGIDNDAIQSENSFSSLTQALIDISNLEQNYAPRLNDLTAQLQQIPPIDDASSGTAKLWSSSKTAEQIALIPKGDKGDPGTASTAIEDNRINTTQAWTSGKVKDTVYADKQISYVHNLFDYNRAERGGYYNELGVWVVSATFVSTDLIPVQPLEKYLQTSSNAVTFWDANKQFVSGIAYPSPVQPANLIVPDNVAIKYMRVAVSTSKLDVYVLTRQNTWATSMVSLKPKYTSDKLIVKNANLSDDFVYEQSKFPLKINDFFNYIVQNFGTNLLDLKKVTWGGYPHPTTGVWLVSALHGTSDFIPTTKLTQYTIQTSLYSYFYDANKVFIGSLNTATFTVPDNDAIAYMRVAVTTSHANDAMLVEGATYPSVYIPYTTFAFDNKSFNLEVSSKLKGKIWNVLGDSITQGGTYDGQVINTYHKQISDLYGITVNNHGVGGTTIAVRNGYTNSFLERYAAMPTADIITVMGGTNDMLQNVPVGVYGDTVTTTFYGACDALFNGLVVKYPDKIIAVIAPVQNKGDYATLEPYVVALEKVASKYSLPFLDLFRHGGLNPDVQTTLFDSFGTHPFSAGHTIMAGKIKPFLENQML